MRHHLILRVVSKMLIPAILLYGLYVQFHGDYGPGGGFQAGVIFGAGFALYAIVFSLEAARRAAPPYVIRVCAAGGAFLYVAVGYGSLLYGGEFLNYSAFDPHDPKHGQHLGIFLVELGVGITVAAVMIAIFSAFAGRPPEMRDEDW